MKKFFTLIAAVAMAASVNANSVFQPSDEQVAAGTIAANTKLIDDDDLGITVTNAYETKVAASPLKIDWTEYTNKFQLRTDGDPSTENTLGKERTGCTSLIVNVDTYGDVKFTVYGRRQTVDGKCGENDGKDLLLVSHADFTEPLTADEYETELIGDGKYATFVKTYILESGLYTVYRGGSTMNIYEIAAIGGPTGINSAVVEVESADAPAYNLAGQKVGENAKGIIIQNGKKYIRK